MKRKSGGVLFLVFGVIALIASPKTVGEAKNKTALDGPNDTSITLTVQISPVGQITSAAWVANGAVVDSGFWFFLSFDDSGSIVHSPVVGTAKLTLLLVGQDGSTATLQENDHIDLNSQSGSWHVVDGTGAYSTFHGAGRYSIDVQTSPGGRTVTWQLDGHTTFGQP